MSVRSRRCLGGCIHNDASLTIGMGRGLPMDRWRIQDYWSTSRFRSASNLSAASRSMLGSRWLYVLSVIPMVLCPKRSCGVVNLSNGGE